MEKATDQDVLPCMCCDHLKKDTGYMNKFFLYLFIVVVFSATGCTHEPDIFDEVREGHIERVREMIKEDPSLVHRTDDEGRTPLHHAYLNEHYKIAEVLIEAGADQKARDDNGISPRTIDVLKRLKPI